MTRYHINPLTHRPNKCEAKYRCRFQQEGGIPVPHYPTKEAAQKAVEKQAEDELGLTTTLSKRGSQDSSRRTQGLLPAWAQNESPVFQRNLQRYQQHLTPLSFPTEEESKKRTEELYHEYEHQLSHHEGGPEEAEEALNQYTGTAYEYVNTLLRHERSWDKAEELVDEGGVSLGWIDDPDELLDHTDSLMDVIDTLMEEHRQREVPTVRTLYRYRHHRSADNFVEKYYEPGMIVADKAYMSTTEDPSLMTGVARLDELKRSDHEGELFVLQIVTREGISGQQTFSSLPFQAQDFEQERLLPRELRLRVVGVKKKEFTAAEDRSSFHHYFDYAGFGKERKEQVPARTLTVVELVEEDLLQDETNG